MAPAISRSGSSIILVAVTDSGSHTLGIAKGFNPTQNYRYTFEQFLGEYLWREAVLHGITANFTILQNLRFDRMLRDMRITPSPKNPLAIEPRHILRVVSLPDFNDMMLLEGAVVENESFSMNAADTLTTNISGSARLIVTQNELNGQAS